MFFFLAVVFSYLLAGLESRPFLSMLVTFYYSLIKKIDIRPLFCTFYLLFGFKVTNNSIPPYSISILATVNNIFLVGAINKLIKSIVEYIR